MKNKSHKDSEKERLAKKIKKILEEKVRIMERLLKTSKKLAEMALRD